MFQSNFERKEKKYLLSDAQYSAIMPLIEPYIEPDRYHDSMIGNIYYDMPDFLLIRRSLEKPVYKEKLRLRCYGVPEDDSLCFIELKKKLKGVVYKRRLCTDYLSALSFLSGGAPPDSSQISKELEYFIGFYGELAPSSVGSYHRLSYRGVNDPSLRITVDSDILFRFDELDLRSGFFGAPIISPEHRLMEIKTVGAFPIWLCHILDSLDIYPVSFSKYGTAYRTGVLLPKDSGVSDKYI